MTILVTGGAGYIGSHTVKLLSEAKQKVVVYDNLSTGSTDALLYGEKLIVADLADQDALRAAFIENHVKAVIHFAASTIVPESVQNPLKYYNNNTVNTLNLIQACIEHKVKNFVFSSTAAVYGLAESTVINEQTPPAPISPYGWSKLMSEQMLQDAAHAYNLNYIILRYFNVAGADPQGRIGQRNPQASHLIKICCQAALGLRPHAEIYGTDYPTPDGTGIRDYIHVEDLAQAHLDALHHLEQDGSSLLLNVGYGKGSSVREVINTTKTVTGNDFRVIESARRPADIAHSVADATLIKQKLNWQPKYNDLEKIIMDTWRWEKSQVR
jgi:UDP-glucose 4-epimerase